MRAGFPGVMSAAVGSPFLPSSLNNLQLWLDAADSTTITESSGSVSQWNDKSGGGNNATQGTGSAQPTTNASTQNGKNVLDFDGSDELEVPDASVFDMQTEATIFVVCETTTVAAGVRRLVSKFAAWASGISAALGRFTTSGIKDYDTVGSFVTVSTPTILTYIFDTSDDVQFRNDGAAFETIAGASDPNTNTNNVFIGSASGEFWSGFIGEVIYYNRQLSTAEIAAVEIYLANKWGITI